jgi:hypothetical protein
MLSLVRTFTDAAARRADATPDDPDRAFRAGWSAPVFATPDAEALACGPRAPGPASAPVSAPASPAPHNIAAPRPPTTAPGPSHLISESMCGAFPQTVKAGFSSGAVPVSGCHELFGAAAAVDGSGFRGQTLGRLTNIG